MPALAGPGVEVGDDREVGGERADVDRPARSARLRERRISPISSAWSRAARDSGTRVTSSTMSLRRRSRYASAASALQPDGMPTWTTDLAASEESAVLRVERVADGTEEGLERAPVGGAELCRLGLEGCPDVDRVIPDQGCLAQQYLAGGGAGDGRDDALAVVDLQAGDLAPDEQARAGSCGPPPSRRGRRRCPRSTRSSWRLLALIVPPRPRRVLSDPDRPAPRCGRAGSPRGRR